MSDDRRPSLTDAMNASTAAPLRCESSDVPSLSSGDASPMNVSTKTQGYTSPPPADQSISGPLSPDGLLKPLREAGDNEPKSEKPASPKGTTRQLRRKANPSKTARKEAGEPQSSKEKTAEKKQPPAVAATGKKTTPTTWSRIQQHRPLLSRIAQVVALVLVAIFLYFRASRLLGEYKSDRPQRHSHSFQTPGMDDQGSSSDGSEDASYEDGWNSQTDTIPPNCIGIHIGSSYASAALHAGHFMTPLSFKDERLGVGKKQRTFAAFVHGMDMVSRMAMLRDRALEELEKHDSQIPLKWAVVTKPTPMGVHPHHAHLLHLNKRHLYEDYEASAASKAGGSQDHNQLTTGEMSDALHAVQLDLIDFIPAPVAIAKAYHRASMGFIRRKDNVLVFDFGAKYLTVSILFFGNLTIRASHVHEIGGDDIDVILMQHFGRKLAAAIRNGTEVVEEVLDDAGINTDHKVSMEPEGQDGSDIDSNDEDADWSRALSADHMRDLAAAVEVAKREWSDMVPYKRCGEKFIRTGVNLTIPHLNFSDFIHKDEFAALIRPVTNRVIDNLRVLIDSLHLHQADVAAIFVGGGSTHLKTIRRGIADVFPDIAPQSARGVTPESAAAIGAMHFCEEARTHYQSEGGRAGEL